MKSFFLTVLVCAFSISSFGQLTKKTWLVGGSGSLYSYNEDYSSSNTNFTAKYTNVDISASIGYFVIDKLSAGLRPTFSSFKGESSGGGSTNNYKIAVGPFLRYYFLNTEKQFNLLADLSYQFGVNKNSGGLNDKGKYNVFSAMGGTEIFFNSTVGIEFLFGYSQKLITIDNPSTASKSNKTGFQASIGFQIHLEK